MKLKYITPDVSTFESFLSFFLPILPNLNITILGVRILENNPGGDTERERERRREGCLLSVISQTFCIVISIVDILLLHRTVRISIRD